MPTLPSPQVKVIICSDETIYIRLINKANRPLLTFYKQPIFHNRIHTIHPLFYSSDKPTRLRSLIIKGYSEKQSIQFDKPEDFEIWKQENRILFEKGYLELIVK